MLLLLKSSDRIAHDLCHALDDCSDRAANLHQPLVFTLALRKWHALRPGREFRCFVRGHDLIGASSRSLQRTPFGHRLTEFADSCEPIFGFNPIQHATALAESSVRKVGIYQCFLKDALTFNRQTAFHPSAKALSCKFGAGICQRQITEQFPGLEDERESLAEVLLEFFEDHLEHCFPDPDYTFDVYITSANKVTTIWQ